MPIIRRARATWKGSGKTGSGSINSTSGAFKDIPHSFTTRFENEDGKAGTNPEELVAAALAGCFTMKLSFVLDGAGYTADLLECSAEVKMDQVGDGKGVVGIHLVLNATVRGIEEDKFQKCAENARANCPISQLLKSVPITLSASLLRP